jgi:hypothetical protein
MNLLRVEMLFEILKPRLTPRILYFKQYFTTSEVIQQTRKRKHFLNKCSFFLRSQGQPYLAALMANKGYWKPILTRISQDSFVLNIIFISVY